MIALNKIIKEQGHLKQGLWLVATYNKMIMASEWVEREELTQKKTFEAIYKEYPNLDEKRESVEWYVGTEEDLVFYDKVMAEHPEYMFLTVDEVNGGNELLETGQFSTDYDTPEGWMEYYLNMHAVIDGAEREINLTPNVIEVGGSHLDRQYIEKILFRLANLKLAGTKFQKVSWEIYDEIISRNIDIAYITRIDKNNYVYIFSDYFYMT